MRWIPGLLFTFLGAIGTCFAALPFGWQDADLGSPGVTGSAGYTNGTWTVSGGGSEICNLDQFHFAWNGVNGDTWIVARLETLQNAATPEAGLMFRNDLTAGAVSAVVLASAGNGLRFEWRTSPGLTCYYQIALGAQNLGAPVWLKLMRAGTTVSAYYSTNNLDWSVVGSPQTVPLNTFGLGGLAVCANNNSALCTAVFSGLQLPQPGFGIYRELWPNLNSSLGNNLAALTNSSYSPGWPDNPDPDYTGVFMQFETQTNSGMSWYGQRLQAFIIPPLTGQYRFWISSHNTSVLFLSSDETPAGAAPVAWVNTDTLPREWTLETNQQSAPISLMAGHRYYLEAIMQQSTELDNLAVRWQLPTGTNEELTAASSPADWRRGRKVRGCGTLAVAARTCMAVKPGAAILAAPTCLRNWRRFMMNGGHSRQVIDSLASSAVNYIRSFHCSISTVETGPVTPNWLTVLSSSRFEPG